MTSPLELSISFRHKGTDYDINLVKCERSEHSVKINGMAYAVLGEKEKLDMACRILESVSLDLISNSEDLKGRLSLCEDISFPVHKTDNVGTRTLGTKQEFRAWRKDEDEKKSLSTSKIFSPKLLGTNSRTPGP